MTQAEFSKPKRWSAQRKKEAILRLLKGELIDDLSRELGIESYRLDEWRMQALGGIESSFKDRDNDPLKDELSRAKQRIGDLSMQIELLNERIEKKGPFRMRRSK